MKTLVIAVAFVAYVAVSVSGDPEADAEPSRYGGGFGGHGLVSYRPVYSSYGYGRWKRSAEPVAEAEAEPEADPSRFGHGYGSYGHVSFRPVYSSYGYGRWKRSAEPVAEAEAEPEADPSRFGYGLWQLWARVLQARVQQLRLWTLEEEC
ncbi:uncharacterized protein LOC134766724 [Penaeus indicus]|uniref:uncharacterized protein LOC134766724 n=1 Tax=Penaeus indicus TaxID=29960 RepID=UPI00300C421F